MDNPLKTDLDHILTHTRGLWDEGNLSHVIHMATDDSHRLTVKAPMLMVGTILHGVWHTLDFARYCGVRKFPMGSSGAAYGKQPADLTHIPEEYSGIIDVTHPAVAFVEGKQVAELLCLNYSK